MQRSTDGFAVMGSDCDDLRGPVDCTTRKLVELNCDDPRDETTSRITLVDRNGYRNRMREASNLRAKDPINFR